ncbi:MAG: hypothetical protein ACFE0O_14460 [Opitutales bacterium]
MSDSYGYARIVKQMGELPVGGRQGFPLNLVFNTNPLREPGTFGPYWYLPLLRTTVGVYSQYRLYWDGPDEYRHFFVLDRTAETDRDEQVFRHRGQEWVATVADDGEVLIEATERADWWYRFQDGQLQGFRMGTACPEYRVGWSGRGLIRYIEEAGSRDRVLEIDYAGTTIPERIQVGEERLSVTMGEGDAVSPDGQTPYKNYRVSFLRELTWPDGRREAYQYAEGAIRTRPEDTRLRARTNRMIIQSWPVPAPEAATNALAADTDSSPEPPVAPTESFVAWEAQSGFLVADSAGHYTVSNDDWDPLKHDGRIPDRPHPRAVRLEHQAPDAQKPTIWAYDWNKGIRTRTEPETGRLIRDFFIMSEGGGHLNLRKKEEKTDEGWKTLERRSYDTQGRLLRRWEEGLLTIWKRKDRPDGSYTIDRFENERLVHQALYDPDGTITDWKQFKDNGEEHWFAVRREAGTGAKVVYHRVDGELFSFKRLNADGRIAYMEVANGRKQWFRYPETGRETLIHSPSGRQLLIKRRKGTRNIQITESQPIQSWLESFNDIVQY